MVEASLGNYVTVQSDPLYLFIEDPCYSTDIRNQVIPNLVFSIGDINPTTYLLPKYKDSVSEEYSAEFGDGSGTDLCGP